MDSTLDVREHLEHETIELVKLFKMATEFGHRSLMESIQHKSTVVDMMRLWVECTEQYNNPDMLKSALSAINDSPLDQHSVSDVIMVISDVTGGTLPDRFLISFIWRFLNRESEGTIDFERMAGLFNESGDKYSDFRSNVNLSLNAISLLASGVPYEWAVEHARS